MRSSAAAGRRYDIAHRIATVAYDRAQLGESFTQEEAIADAPSEPDDVESLGARPSRDAILAAVSTTIAWGPLMRKRISRLTAETLPWYLRLYGVVIGASIPARHHQHGSLCGISREERFSRWSMADVLFLALTGKKPSPAEAKPL